MTTEAVPATITPINPNSDVQNTVFVTVAGNELQKNLDSLGLNIDSSEQEILEVLRPIVDEEFGEDIKSGSSWLYKVRKSLDTGNIFVIPNSVAG